MADGSGYAIKKFGTESSASELDSAAGQLASVQKSLPQESCSRPESFGGEDVAPAFDNFAGAWQREATVLHDALGEIAKKLRTTTANYGAADHSAISGLRHAAAAAPAPSGAGSTPFG
ncbi:WXG100 family type VII secretion target [Streptomyces chrestomyceticus]|uniref:WXG100 family type VII secretion target n=1 Tax=Streptomyces chrestomyceticus TaxID=68185 RepID=UPI00367CFF25